MLVGMYPGSVELWRTNLKLDELLEWVHHNRYIPELTCEQRALYQVELLCRRP